mgnify:CR=1 FL=1
MIVFDKNIKDKNNEGTLNNSNSVSLDSKKALNDEIQKDVHYKYYDFRKSKVLDSRESLTKSNKKKLEKEPRFKN